MCSLDWLVHSGVAADKQGLEGNHPNLIKHKCGKPTANSTLKTERPERCVDYRKARMPLPPP